MARKASVRIMAVNDAVSATKVCTESTLTSVFIRFAHLALVYTRLEHQFVQLLEFLKNNILQYCARFYFRLQRHQCSHKNIYLSSIILKLGKHLKFLKIFLFLLLLYGFPVVWNHCRTQHMFRGVRKGRGERKYLCCFLKKAVQSSSSPAVLI